MDSGAIVANETVNVNDISAEDVVLVTGEKEENSGGTPSSDQDNPQPADQAEGGDQSGGDSTDTDEDAGAEGGTSETTVSLTSDTDQHGDGSEITDEEAFSQLSEETGIEVTSDASIVDA